MKRWLNKKGLIFLALTILLVGVFLVAKPVFALDTVSTIVAKVLGWIVYGFVYVTGALLFCVMFVLIKVAQYNNFINADPVVYGWGIVRDLCNMFFILIMLIIAFATILQVEQYSIKKMLPKLILMAVLINFSKLICGFLIDFAQIIMLTFVNGFKDIGGANLTNMLGIDKLMTISGGSTDANSDVTLWSIAGSYMLALIYSVIALVVITALLGVLIMRMIMLWVYVVLSPIAYLMAAVPGGQKYSSQWWDEFSKNVIIGPVLAFFIWLSFASLGGVEDPKVVADIRSKGNTQSGVEDKFGTVSQGPSAGITEAGSPDHMIKFAISIAMLIGGLMVSQQIGGQAGAIAGKGMSRLQKIGSGTLRVGGKLGKSSLKTLGHWGGDIRDKVGLAAGVDFNVVAGYKRYREAVQQRRADRTQELRGKVLEKTEKGKTWMGRKLALASTGDVAYDNFKEHNFLKGGGVYRYSQKIEESEKKLNEVKGERSKVMTYDEQNAKIDSLNLDANKITLDIADVDADISKKTGEIAKARQGGNYTGTSQEVRDNEELQALNDRKSGLFTTRSNITQERTSLQTFMSTSQSAASHQKAKELDQKVAVTQKEYDETHKKYQEKIDKRSLVGLTEARIGSQAKVEAEQGKVVAHINNADELVRIMKEGIRTGQQGLVSVAWKKLARTGNYNEANKALGVGTGYKGMLAAAKILQKDGGFDEQTARGLIAEVGEVAKSSSMHMEAFGCMKMDKGGNWQEATEVEHDASVLAEKTKVQSQKFCRDANRLATGYYEGPVHDEAHWRPSASTIALYASKDAAYASDMEKTGNPNQIYFMGSNPDFLKTLETNGAPMVAKVVRDFMAKSKGRGVSDYEAAIRKVLNTQ